MRISLFLLIFVLFLFQLVFPSDPVRLSDLLPEIEGWKISDGPHQYNRDNLYEYINGNCELYFSYGFRELISAYYQDLADPSREITVDIYDQGTVLNAFGVYSSMIHPDYDYERIGNEAIISTQEIRFWKNRFEVEIRSNFSDLSVEVLTTFAQTIAEKIPADSAIAELQWLVKEDQIPHTLKYVASGFLGQDFLPGGFEARYDLDGTSVKGFVIGCDDTLQTVKKLQQFFDAQNNFKDMQVQTIRNGFQSYHQYTGYLVIKRYNHWLYGAISETNFEVCQTLSERLLEHLSLLVP